MPDHAMSPEPGAQISWSFAKRILFRLSFSYILLFTFTYLFLYNNDLPRFLTYVPFAEALAERYSDLSDFLVHRVGTAMFHADTSVPPNGSGDTTYNYVQVFCFLLAALAATAIWTVLDRKRANYVRLHEWLRVCVRFALAFWMLEYGSVKVIPVQVARPSLDRLLQPFGDASPEGMFWTFMGVSMAYTIFSGLAEMVGGLLLAFRRTALLGALVCIAVLTNVVTLNFCYDVSVKLFSSHLLALAVFLALPGLGRLANFLVFNRKVEPIAIRPLFTTKWLDRGALVLCSVFAFGFTAFLLVQSYEITRSRAAKSPLHGLWNVEEFVVDGQVRPPLITDEARWRRVVFDGPHVMAVLLGDSRERFHLELDPGAHTLTLAKRDVPEWKSAFSYQRLDPHLLALEGTFDGQKIQARLRKAEEPKFRLVSRGSHWIHDYPYFY
jgi:multidrug transporter EmrE-like cation transporter